MQPPDKKRRKEIRNAIREKEAQLWAQQAAEIQKRTTYLSENMELKPCESVDRLHCDALFRKLETMAALKEIRLLSGSFNSNGNPIEFAVVATGLKYSFQYSDMTRSGNCSLRSI